MQPARSGALSAARSAARPEPWAAFLGLPEIRDATPKRFVGKTAKAIGRVKEPAPP